MESLDPIIHGPGWLAIFRWDPLMRLSLDSASIRESYCLPQLGPLERQDGEAHIALRAFADPDFERAIERRGPFPSIRELK